MTGVDKNEYIAGRSQVEYFEDRELDVEKQGGDVLDMCRGGMAGVMKLELPDRRGRGRPRESLWMQRICVTEDARDREGRR